MTTSTVASVRSAQWLLSISQESSQPLRTLFSPLPVSSPVHRCTRQRNLPSMGKNLRHRS